MDTPRQVIRAKILAGSLRRDAYVRSRFGKGTGAPCAGCELSITAEQVEVQVEFRDNATLRFHSPCFDIWRVETQWPASPFRQ